MPSARNLGWYALNATRPYPLDDSALLTDDNGLEIPFDVIVDLYLLFPDSLGQYAFLSSLTVSKGIVTATFQATPNPAAQPGCVSPGVAVSSFVPLASVSVPQKGLTPFRQYPLDAQNNGVGGWIVFGSGVQNFPYYGRFSNPQQSMVSSRCGKKYFQLPVQGIGKMGNASVLDDMVLLKSGSDIEIVTAAREVGGKAKNVIVVRLKDTESPDTNRNVFDIYKGPCGGRPESGSCGDPQPIEFIGPVGPDCCGNITLEFKGCADVAQVTNNCGVVLDCGFGLIDACVKPQWLPKHGILPNEYADLCAGYSLVSHSLHLHSSSYGYQHIPDCSLNVTPGLPLIDYFNNQVASGFQVIEGTWGFIEDESLETPCLVPGTVPRYAYWTRDPSQLNLSIWQTGITNWIPYNKGMTAAVKLRKGLDGMLHNGALVFNYRSVAVQPPPPPPNGVSWPEAYKPGQTASYKYTATLQGVKANSTVCGALTDVSQVNTTFTLQQIGITSNMPVWSTAQTTIVTACNENRQVQVAINDARVGTDAQGNLTFDYSIWVEVAEYPNPFISQPGNPQGSQALFIKQLSSPISGALSNYIIPFTRYIFQNAEESPFDFSASEIVLNQIAGDRPAPSVALPDQFYRQCAICVGSTLPTIKATVQGFTGCCAGLNGTHDLYFIEADGYRPAAYFYSMPVPFMACDRMFFLQILLCKGPPTFGAKIMVALYEAYAKIPLVPYLGVKNDLELFSEDCQNLDITVQLEPNPYMSSPSLANIQPLCDATQSGVTVTITSGGVSPPVVQPSPPPIQPPADGSFVPDYWMADLNFDGYLQGDKVLRIAHVNNGIVDTKASVSVPDLQVDSWYILDVKIQRILKGVTEFRRITTTARAATTNTILGTVQYDVIQSAFSPETGVFGLQADRAATEFSWAEIYNICGVENYTQKCIYVKDVLGFYDTVGIAHTWNVAIVDVMGLADVPSYVVNRVWTRSIVETIGVASVLAVFPIQIWTRAFSDVIGGNTVLSVDAAGILKVNQIDTIGVADHAGGAIAFQRRLMTVDAVGVNDPVTVTLGRAQGLSTFSVFAMVEPANAPSYGSGLGQAAPQAQGNNVSVYAGGLRVQAGGAVTMGHGVYVNNNINDAWYLLYNSIGSFAGSVSNYGLAGMAAAAQPHVKAYFVGGQNPIVSPAPVFSTQAYIFDFTTFATTTSSPASLPSWSGISDQVGLTEGQSKCYFLSGQDHNGSGIQVGGTTGMYNFKTDYATDVTSAVTNSYTYGIRYGAGSSGTASTGYLLGGSATPWGTYGGPTGHIPNQCGSSGTDSDGIYSFSYATEAIVLSTSSYLPYGCERHAASTDGATKGFIAFGTTCWTVANSPFGCLPLLRFVFATGALSIMQNDFCGGAASAPCYNGRMTTDGQNALLSQCHCDNVIDSPGAGLTAINYATEAISTKNLEQFGYAYQAAASSYVK